MKRSPIVNKTPSLGTYTQAYDPAETDWLIPEGSLWHDTSRGVVLLRVAGRWKAVDHAETGPGQEGNQIGDFWVDNSTKEAYVWTGMQWTSFTDNRVHLSPTRRENTHR